MEGDHQDAPVREALGGAPLFGRRDSRTIIHRTPSVTGVEDEGGDGLDVGLRQGMTQLPGHPDEGAGGIAGEPDAGLMEGTGEFGDVPQVTDRCRDHGLGGRR